jgi:hypothetical protein
MPTTRTACAGSPAAVRAERGDAFVARQPGDECVAEALATGTGDHDVGLAVDGAHGLGELRQRRVVDQLHRAGQRHAQRHRQQRRRVAPRVVAPFGPAQRQQAQHGVARPANP